MTRPNFAPTISLGNIIQMVVVLASMAAGGAYIKSAQAANILTLADHETRLRSVEKYTITGPVELREIKADIGEMKSKLATNESLLRQILRGGGMRD